MLLLFIFCSTSEHSVLVMPERDKEPDWKTGERNISGARNRNRCCNSSKSETPKQIHSLENPLKQNGGFSPNQFLQLYQLINNWTVDINLAILDVWQVFVLLALEESVLQNVAAVECMSQVQTQAVLREA